MPAGTRIYPSVEAFLAARDGRAEIFAVLHEDGYETLFGDGEFHYLWNIHLTRADAQRDIERNQKERVGAYQTWGRFHLRALNLALAGGSATVESFSPEVHDNYQPEDILAVLERRLRWDVLNARESPDWMVAWDAPWLVTLDQHSYVYCFSVQGVEAVLANEEREASVHRVPEIKAGCLGPAISREQWRAGER